MAETKIMQGVFPILVTPFNEDWTIDEESLRRLIDFDIEAGVHGLGIALGSEVFKLTEAERGQLTRIVVDQVAGRVPVVVNTGAAATDLAVFYSRMAEDAGADGLMVLPAVSPAAPVNQDEVLEYFQAVSDAVSIPIFVQDTNTAHVPADLAVRIAGSCRQVTHIKVESMPVMEAVASMVETAGDKLTVFGGAGGAFFIEELRSGSLGTMPWATQPHEFVEIWNLCRKGDEEAAKEVFIRKLFPISRISGTGMFYEIQKEILRQRGIIRTAIVRRPSPAMSDMTRRELQRVIDQVYPKG